eukprot:GHRR01020029.1.p1 GENE.GHRR01020029.1~~GHRR01020029.1.p1  ORF type:complete len:315 (+),score=64.10 GHRR01020029.1:533-1477(+)
MCSRCATFIAVTRVPSLAEAHTMHSGLHRTALECQHHQALVCRRALSCRQRPLALLTALNATEPDCSVNSTTAKGIMPTQAAAYILGRQAVCMFASGAVLGPFCDGLHSQNDVLHYKNPSIQLNLVSGNFHWSFETCWWVPLLFGVAGLILGVSVPVLDRIAAGQWQHQGQPDCSATGPVPDPSWQTVLVSVSLFVTQYWLSGILEQPTLGQNLGNTSIPILDTILASYALLNWALFDRTKQGIGMAALTAVCGPAIEMFLISKIGLYHYSHPVVLGVPTWIPWVYYCGGPAVGNLGRRVWHDLAVQHTQEQQQ